MERIALIGPMGSGKTTVGRELAQRLGWDFVDTDDAVVAKVGLSIPALFEKHGEARFRTLEAEVLTEALRQPRVVIATGGGIVLRPENRRKLRQGARVVWLQAAPAVLAERAQQASGHVRPLLSGADPVVRLAQIVNQREAFYRDAAHVAVATEGKDPTAVSEEVLARHAALSPAALAARQPTYFSAQEATETVVPVNLGDRSYEVRLAPGLTPRLGAELRKVLPRVKNALVISDDAVGPLYLDQVLAALQDAGIAARGVEIPAGESSKSLAIAGPLYTDCVAAGLDRSSAIIALGGGVVGDLAGFVAATYMRGIAFVQIPTTLLAQVDASVGGKVAVDLPEGKNLVGAFHQPKLVAVDMAMLRSLPRRDLAAGFAEVVKYAVIRSPGLFAFLHAEAADLLAIDPALLQQMIAENVAIKARVVEADETEQGDRALLNFGHTIGHAYETVAAYEGVLHGEAVAVGMIAAVRISQAIGLLQDPELLPHLEQMLRALELPTRLPSNLAPDEILAATARDKKAQHGSVRWVLPVRVGEMRITADVPRELVREVIASLQIP